MGVVLRRSVFYHIGRTGGHWVTHVLWRSKLIEKRLLPLHITPSVARTEMDLSSKPHSFCFVRHPLNWLASFWRHEMEFGWDASTLSTSTADNNFARFLEKVLANFPNGACEHIMSTYFNQCTFVGRVENLKSDLEKALMEAEEDFDVTLLATPPVNESTSKIIGDACVAPLELLERVMEADKDFCKKFDYKGIPKGIAGSFFSPIWPQLPLKKGIEGPVFPPGELLLRPIFTTFSYMLDNGDFIQGVGSERRLQWSLIKEISNTEWLGKCAVISESDPYFAYYASINNASSVNLFTSNSNILPNRLIDSLECQLEINAINKLLFDDDDTTKFDTIILTDRANLTPNIDTEILQIFSKMTDDGRLIISVPIIKVDFPVSITIPIDLPIRFGVNVNYKSISQWQILLENVGFDDMNVVDTFGIAPHSQLFLDYLERLSVVFGVDPGHLLGMAVITASRSKDALRALTNVNLSDLWTHRRLADLAGQPYDGLPALVEARLLELEHEARIERLRRDHAEQGIADREQELLISRRDCQKLALENDFNIDQLKQIRDEKYFMQVELNKLDERLLQIKEDTNQAIARAFRERAEQGLADRELELLESRHTVQLLAMDADYSRNLLIRTRQEKVQLQMEIDHLRNLFRRIKFDFESELNQSTSG